MADLMMLLVGCSIPAFLFIGLMVVIVNDIRKHYEFLEKYPPISDDEFMEKLPAGTNRDVALRVRQIVAEQSGVDRERIYPETLFVDLMGC